MLISQKYPALLIAIFENKMFEVSHKETLSHLKLFGYTVLSYLRHGC